MICLLSVFSLSACKTIQSKQHNTPADVSARFFKALANLEFDAAKELCTENTARLLGVVQTLSDMGGGVNILRDNKKELIACEEKGDIAICTYKAFSGPDEKVYLVKVKGKWLVEMKAEKVTPNP